jgi:hypothetical protein
MRQVGMVLVTNDTAVAVSLDKEYKHCTPFYFFRSQYQLCKRMPHCDEFEQSHLPWTLNSTWAVYEHGRIKCVHEFESAILLLPKVLPERDVNKYQVQMRKSVIKSLCHSLWTGDNRAVYRECTLEHVKSLQTLKILAAPDPQTSAGASAHLNTSNHYRP